MCSIVPGPSTSIIVAVECAGTLINGRTFQPWPRWMAAPENARSGFDGSGVAIAPAPFPPVGFSGETILDCVPAGRSAIESRLVDIPAAAVCEKPRRPDAIRRKAA